MGLRGHPRRGHPRVPVPAAVHGPVHTPVHTAQPVPALVWPWLLSRSQRGSVVPGVPRAWCNHGRILRGFGDEGSSISHEASCAGSILRCAHAAGVAQEEPRHGRGG